MLGQLDRRIVAALQVDGRASWRKIATALGEPERTVARRGIRLIEEGLVVVTGMASRRRIANSQPAIIGIGCAPGTMRIAAASLARRQETTFAYIVTGRADCIAEIWCPEERLSAFLIDELPGTPGLATVSAYPILRYYRTVHDWQPGILTGDEVAAVAEDGRNVPFTTLAAESPRLTPEDRTVLRALAEDGRRTHEDLGRLAGVSEATIRRRIDAMRRDGTLFFRVVVEPRLLGLPVEALLWIRTTPGTVDAVGNQIIESPRVRYAAAVMGEHQLLVDVTMPSKTALHEFVTLSRWLDDVIAIETGLVIDALKRSAVLKAELRGSRHLVV